MTKGRVEYSNPRVYINNGKVKTITPELFNLLSLQQDKNSEDFRPLVLIVEDIGGDGFERNSFCIWQWSIK